VIGYLPPAIGEKTPMPLAFRSLSHGTIAFGFYNIETDGMLLDRLFFFSTDFCRAVCELDRLLKRADPRAELPGYLFEDPRRIGDLAGAIEGLRHTGYLGEIYLLWPFPSRPEEFRQRLHGASNRKKAEGVLQRWAAPSPITLSFDRETDRFAVGPYRFSSEGYRDLLRYVWRGGYPTWEGVEEGHRPQCVAELVRLIAPLHPPDSRPSE
jgi:hypothetical protein